MNQKFLIGVAVILFLAVLVLLGLRFYSPEDNWLCQNGQWIKHGNPEASMPTSGCGAENNSQNTSAEGQPAENVEVPMVNIQVSSPVNNQKVGLPLVVQGQARVWENTVNIRLLEKKSRRVLVEDFVTADAPDMGEFGPFSKELYYPTPKESEGILEVFDYSAKDGTEQDKVIIPVIFEKIEEMTVKVFFGNEKKNPGAIDCAKVFSVERRIPKTQAVGRAALEQLLAGVKANEGKLGYFSQINPGVEIQSLKIENGVAKADFSQELNEGVGGSCKVEAIRAEITETLKQFPTIKSVIISVNGNSETILQP